MVKNTMFGLGTREIIILAGIFILLFGSKKIPELTRNLGQAAKHIKNMFSAAEAKDTTDKIDKKG